MSILLSTHYEKLAPRGAYTPLPDAQLLYHQARTVHALQAASLVVNSYNTGTGKTRASLLHLFQLQGQRRNVLFIAPTNALIRQHTEDIQAFVQTHSLPFRVIEVNAEAIRRLGVNLAMPERGGEKLHRLLQNPLEFYRELAIPVDDQRSLPYVLVVNPDIFHYMLFFCYGPHDQRNLFSDALQSFWYVVIDEFHYYDEKQLVSFLAFLTFWQELGYFDQGRKVCLLSATPNAQVEAYLTALLGTDWQHISPDNEPEHSQAYSVTQTLTELELDLIDVPLDQWLRQERTKVELWLQQAYDGAIISNSLDRINAAYDLLSNLDVARLTGPESAEQRLLALNHQLLLATPVVDIGYNFDRQKARQNIDFVVCEGRFRDDLIQRLGRAGRVLGKPQQDQRSYAVALINHDAVQALSQYEGHTITRHMFREALSHIDGLPPKHALGNYMRVHGLVEAFYPVYKFSQMLAPDQQQYEVEHLVERLRAVLAPRSRQCIGSLRTVAASFDQRSRWVHARTSDKWSQDSRNTKILVNNLAAYLGWLSSSQGQCQIVSAEQAHTLLPMILADHKHREGLTTFIQSQYYLTRSLFAFRDSFNGPTAVLFDPDRLFSSTAYNTYDLLHIIRNYQFHLFSDHQDFSRHCTSDLTAEWYVQLQARRIPRLQLEFTLNLAEAGISVARQEDFEFLYCRHPIALSGLKISTRQKDGGIVPILPALRHSLHSQYITMLIVPDRDKGALIATTRHMSIINYPLEVTLPDGNNLYCCVVLGSAAWHANAALQRHFRIRDRQEDCDAIIL